MRAWAILESFFSMNRQDLLRTRTGKASDELVVLRQFSLATAAGQSWSLRADAVSH